MVITYDGKGPAIATPNTSLKEGYDHSEETYGPNVKIILSDTPWETSAQKESIARGCSVESIFSNGDGAALVSCPQHRWAC